MKVGGIYEIWNAYASTFGFPDYKQTQIQYADRTPMEGDELKTANDPVTEAERRYPWRSSWCRRRRSIQPRYNAYRPY